MNINSLDKMEEIVQNNKKLSWDGWTVVALEASEKARTSVNGVLINNKWYLSKRFEPNANGWEIPDKFVR